MHFGLTEEQGMIVSTVRSFVENEIYPHEAEVERTGEVHHDIAHLVAPGAQHFTVWLHIIAIMVIQSEQQISNSMNVFARHCHLHLVDSSTTKFIFVSAEILQHSLAKRC